MILVANALIDPFDVSFAIKSEEDGKPCIRISMKSTGECLGIMFDSKEEMGRCYEDMLKAFGFERSVRPSA